MKQRFSEYYPYIGVFLFYVLLCLYNPDSGFDKAFDIWWSHDILHGGITNIYDTSSVNYPPLVLYVLYVFTWFMDSASDINLDSINYLKPFKMFFDVVVLFELIYFIKKLNKSIWILFFFLLNGAYWYNTVVWAQYDTMVAAFLMGAFLCAFEKKWIWMVLLFMLSLNTKHIPIIFFPVLFLITASEIRWDLKLWIKLLVFMILIQTIIFLPFIWSGNLGIAIHSIFGRTVSHHASLTLYAHNIWYFLSQHGDPITVTDTQPFWGMKYLNWGFIFFFSYYALIITKPLIELYKRNTLFFTQERMLLLTALTGLGFYYFNVEMHERYLHIPLIFLGFYAVISKKWLAFVYLSFVFFCTLESVMQAFEYLNIGIFNQKKEYINWFIFNRQFMAAQIGLCLIYYTYLYLKDFRPNKLEIVNS